MIIRPVFDRYPITFRNYGKPRTPGVHLSSVLRHLVIRTGTESWGQDSLDEIIDRHDFNPGKLMPGQLARLVLGYMWEEWCFRNVLKDALSHLGEFTLDGIIGTPDAIEPLDLLYIHECKGTFKSSAKGIPNVWVYQGAGYMMQVSKTLGYRLEDCRLVIHPFHIRGNYRGIDPEYLPQEIELEPGEIVGIWKSFLEEVEIMKQEGIAK